MLGIVGSYNKKYKFGSIYCNIDGQDRDVFCNKLDLINVEFLVAGDKVEFILGKGGRAHDVFLIKKGA